MRVVRVSSAVGFFVFSCEVFAILAQHGDAGFNVFSAPAPDVYREA